MGRNLDLSLEKEDLDDTRSHRLVTTEARTIHIPAWDEDKLVACDRAARDLAIIGLHLHVARTFSDHLPASLPKKRFSGFRVPLDAVLLQVQGHPGQTAEVYAEELFRTEPWTDLAKEGAKRRFLVAAKRLKDQGRISEDHDLSGRPVYGSAGWTRDTKPARALDPNEIKALRTLSPILGGDVTKAREVWSAIRNMMGGAL